VRSFGFQVSKNDICESISLFPLVLLGRRWAKGDSQQGVPFDVLMSKSLFLLVLLSQPDSPTLSIRHPLPHSGGLPCVGAPASAPKLHGQVRSDKARIQALLGLDNLPGAEARNPCLQYEKKRWSNRCVHVPGDPKIPSSPHRPPRERCWSNHCENVAGQITARTSLVKSLRERCWSHHCENVAGQITARTSLVKSLRGKGTSAAQAGQISPDF